MLKKANRLIDRKQLRRTCWLALLALAWLQVSLASHQFDHVAGDFADSCHVCVQFDRFDDTVAEPPAAATVLPVGLAEQQETLPELADHQSVAGFDARAPPRL